MIKTFFNNFATAWKLPRWRWALLLALISDILGFVFTFTPPVHWTIDVVTVIVLFAAIGFKWLLLPALVVEVIPGLQLFPAWTLVVLALAGTENNAESKNDSST
jgi:hypothetical protein